jgi:hypothetical protein
MIQLDAAAKTFTIVARPAMANPEMLLQQGAEAEETGGIGVTTALPPADPTAAQADAKSMLAAYGWDNNTQWTCLYDLWEQESSWNVYATNPESLAYGIPQADPGDQMASAGADWQTNPVTQIKWGLGYISSRYGTPCVAWQHELKYWSY